jgi:hypothetical protein
MIAAPRKALSSVMHFFSTSVWSRGTSSQRAEDDTHHRVGEYFADYSEPSLEQINKPQPELDELFKNSKVVSVKREP